MPHRLGSVRSVLTPQAILEPSGDQAAKQPSVSRWGYRRITRELPVAGFTMSAEPLQESHSMATSVPSGDQCGCSVSAAANRAFSAVPSALIVYVMLLPGLSGLP